MSDDCRENHEALCRAIDKKISLNMSILLSQITAVKETLGIRIDNLKESTKVSKANWIAGTAIIMSLLAIVLNFIRS